MHLTPNFGLEREINISFVRIQRLLVLSLFFFFVRLRNTWRSRSATAPCFGFVVFSRSRLRKTVCSESIQSRLASSLQSVCTSVRFSNGEMCEMSVNQVRCGRVVYFCGITRPTDERERERESVMEVNLLILLICSSLPGFRGQQQTPDGNSERSGSAFIAAQL